jgi:DNA-binding transcriptional LysR family regulator
VSNAIAMQESRLGVRLFERSRTSIRLTDEGEALRVKAQLLDQLLRDAEAVVASATEGIAGPLRVGGTPGALVSLLPRAIELLERKQPRFALNVLERPDRDLVGMLREGAIELAFVTTAIEEPPEDIEESTISRDPFALIVGRANDALPDSVSLKDVRNLRWVLPEAQGAFRRQVMAAAGPMPRLAEWRRRPALSAR